MNPGTDESGAITDEKTTERLKAYLTGFTEFAAGQ